MTDHPEREELTEAGAESMDADAAFTDADAVSTEETPVTDLPTAENQAQPEPVQEQTYPTGPVTEALAAPASSTGAVPLAQPAHAAPRPSVLERVRENRMGPAAATLGVGLVVALLLAVLVPGSPNLYASLVLGLLVTAAVGFTARTLAGERGWEGIATAFLSAVIAVHVLAVTGTVNGAGPGELLEQIGVQGPGFDDAILAALATPPVSTGGLLAGLVAGLIAGWGRRA